MNFAYMRSDEIEDYIMKVCEEKPEITISEPKEKNDEAEERILHNPLIEIEEKTQNSDKNINNNLFNFFDKKN